ncbi:hypothetical protein DFP73DRAFT_142357 [Morchella snyderi]|nr:hypothetical protein DFP73DRAFT_142357 [Morchella snyderi]
MSFGFSVGDIISVGQLAVKLYDCLSGNVDEECRALRSSLMSLQRSINIASEVFSREPGEEDISLNTAITDELRILGEILNTYLSAYKKYFDSAKIDKNDRKIKDKWGIIKWSLTHEGTARELESTLLFHINAFQSYVLEMIFQTVFRTNKNVQEGVAEVKDVKKSVVRGFEEVDSEFKTMMEKLDKADSRFSQLSKEVANAVNRPHPCFA